MYEKIKQAAKKSELGSLYALSRHLGLNARKNPLKSYFEGAIKKLNYRLSFIGLRIELVELSAELFYFKKTNTMRNNKLGLYACYSKTTGHLISSSVKSRFDVKQAGKEINSKHIYELITEDKNKIYEYPKDKIPKMSSNITEDDMMSNSDEFYRCDLCNEFYSVEEMDYIAPDDSSFCSQCQNCA